MYNEKTGQLETVKHNTDASSENDVEYTFTYDALGRKVRVQVGSATLSENEYQNDPAKANYGTLSKMTYGNGDCVRNQYDDFNRVTGVVYNNETDPRYEYAYNAKGQVAHVRNNLIGQITESEYDLANRPCRVKVHEADGTHVYTGEAAYDDTFGNLSKFKEKVGEARSEYSTTFGYDEENRPTSLSYGDYGSSATAYDQLGRVRQRSVTAGSGATNTTTYAFEAGGHGENSTTGLVKSISQTGGNFAYTYDDNGNIASVVQDGVTTSYTYDALGQLIRVDDEQENATWVYAYDMGGNILNKQKFALGMTTGTPVESKVFTYGNANWRDQLTAVDGVAITYDAIGNPLNDGTWTYTWQNGRQLARMQSVDTDASFVYNKNGLRVQKTINGVVTKYTLHGKNIVHMMQGNDELHFFYDASGKPAIVVYNGVPFSYVKNLQGDIVAILDANGAVVVSYVYDAWGRPINKAGSMAATLGTVQPFRYRSYVYDEETGLHYLRSRYYNSMATRFINADLVYEANLFTYCADSPICYTDTDGFTLEDCVRHDANDAITLFTEGGLGGGYVADLSMASNASLWTSPLLLGQWEGYFVQTPYTQLLDYGTQRSGYASEKYSATDVGIGWHVGMNIRNYTISGNTPSWSTVRARWWKNEAFYNPEYYRRIFGEDGLNRMREGKPPLGLDKMPIDLHHPLGRDGDNFFIFYPIEHNKHKEIHYGQ